MHNNCDIIFKIETVKYKTIIFSIFGNPIFHDTFMFSDIYPQYLNYPNCGRKNNIKEKENLERLLLREFSEMLKEK